MIQSELAWIENLFETVGNRVESVEHAVVAELKHLHERQKIIATAIHHLFERNKDMTDLTDAIRAEIAAVSGDIDTLIAQKAKDDSAALVDIKSDMDALKTKVAGALAPSGTVAGAAFGANQGSASTPVVGSTSTSVTDSVSGSTTTVDHATGEASTTDAAGTPVATDTDAAQAATDAATAAGVTVGG